ncbi:ABC-type transport system involved in resistance to organic solvents [Collimonas arenae]|uniref:ABC-type transport system involved in resistance to organic solvents n=1 Tax=Collimonas arenae TaxID=279058 RepID=A0A0A1FJ80_9BURK|nr:MlaD family protein [Collimonas arenae]AIY42957.1 ABC-type transport system involved in resistance to organic solvents [Collimonas arenae]
MENRAHALSAGLFLVLLCVGLIFVAIRLNGDTADQQDYLLVSRTPVSGLNRNAPVRLRGVDVGKVKDIQFSASDPHVILIKIGVDKGTPVNQGTYAQLSYLGITGLSFVQLDDDGGKPAKLVLNSDGIGRIEMRPSFFDQVGNSGQELLRDTGQAAKRVNKLLDDENLEQLSLTIANLKTASGRIADLAAELQPTVKALPAISTHTDKALARMDPLLANLNTLTQEVHARVGTLDRIGKTADDLDQTSQDLKDSLPQLHVMVGDFSRSSRTLDRVLSDIQQQPQSLLFGKSPAAPGPGENGFLAPTAAR